MASGKAPVAPTAEYPFPTYPGPVEGGEAGTGAVSYVQHGALARSSSTRSNASGAPPPNGYLPIRATEDELTLINTITNAGFPNPAQQTTGDRPFSVTMTPSIAHLLVAHPRPAKFTEEWDASQRGSSIIDGGGGAGAGAGAMQRSNSIAGSTAAEAQERLSRGNTLKKKPSLRRGGSLKRSGSRRSMKAGSVRSLALQSTSNDGEDLHSAFYCPVPTNGLPTETLANRFQAWRKILKDLITYFREIQNHYEQRSKALLKLANVLNNTSMPPGFLQSGGLVDALEILRNYNKQAIMEANKAREIEEDVILALTGLRSDLHQKIKEIKNLAGDFKNSVEKEMDATRRAVKTLGESLGLSEVDSATVTGKQDPYLLRLAADRQLERQIEEENYLHKAYLNLESSGRELESIVVGEVQKAYNAYAGILKREGEAVFNTVEELRSGPIAMPKDHEWTQFVSRDDKFVNPDVAMRSSLFIHYPGRNHYACQEIREGLLERKSKYLRSYTAGWYVLSPTHIHEFRSADKAQAPVMSLYLPEQKLGSHSVDGASSNKFVLKGRQTGSMHRGHTWVFRAESYDTMMAWYEDIKALSEKTAEELNTFVKGHARSFSRNSQRSVSSDGAVDEDDVADQQPFAPEAAAISSRQSSVARDGNNVVQRRPSPGGRFPSELTVNAERGLQVPPISPASVNSGFQHMLPPQHPQQLHQQQHLAAALEPDAAATIAAASALPGSDFGQFNDPRLGYGSTIRTPLGEAPSHAAMLSQEAHEDGVNPYTSEPIYATTTTTTTANTGKRLSIASNGGGTAGAGHGESHHHHHHHHHQPTSTTTAGADVGVSPGLSHNHHHQQFAGAGAAASHTPGAGADALPNGYTSPDHHQHHSIQAPIPISPVPIAPPTVSSVGGGSSSNLDSAGSDSYVSGAPPSRSPRVSMMASSSSGGAGYDGAGFPPPSGVLQHQQQQPRTATVTVAAANASANGGTAPGTATTATTTPTATTKVASGARPTAGTVRTDSVPTISNLHIPGGYPKSTPTM